MTDPLIQTFCCQKPVHPDNSFTNLILEIDSRQYTDPYNIICLISSTIGIFGSIYQLLPRVGGEFPYHWYWITAKRGRKIVAWLAFADLFASLGIFCRSAIKLSAPDLLTRLKTNGILCYLFAFWIQYFYVVSWIWTLIYAVDMYLALHERPGYFKLYHCISWILPAIITFIGLFLLYYPHPFCYYLTEADFYRLLPNYILTYSPMLTVMIANPVLYVLSSRSMHAIVAQYLSQYTRRERYIVDMISLKFGLINLTFYACWLPNLINTAIIYFAWDDLPEKIVVTIWYIMAIMNPLQAFFNSLVYQRPQDRIKFPCFSQSPSSYYSERTPLLARSGSSANSDESDYVL